MTDNNNKSTLKEAFDAELMKRLEENPPEIPTYEEFSAMVDKSLAERCCRRKRIAGIAAGFVVVLLAGILACTNLTTDVDADKNPKEEIITEDGVIIEDGGWGSSDGEDNVWSTTEWEYVKTVKEIYSEILIPKYIPDEFTFKKLTIETIETGATTCQFVFADFDNNIIEIEEVFHTTLLNSMDVTGVIRSFESKIGTVYIQQGENEIATLQTKDGINIYIIGTLSDEERINIINNLGY
ncbi:MAG: hypothetical protein Q4F78_03650 [Bacillota bacterium]|nr:hypothetical protein [Bacillota bacterium]